MTKSTLPLLVLTALPAVAAPPKAVDPVKPEPAAEHATLPPLIVSATREPESTFEVPYSAVVLGRDWLEERAVRSLPDSLKELPGVMVQKTAAGQGSPYIRGFTGFRTLAMIDGIRLNNSTFREGPNQYWNTIDVYGLDAIELTRGQGSVLYGSDAIGGTLNARTKGPQYFPAISDGKSPAVAGWHTGGQLFTRYASGENAWIGHAEGYLSQDKAFGLFLGGSVKNLGSIRAADIGTLPKTGYDEYDIDAKAEFWLDDAMKLTLAHQQVHQDDVWRTHRTIYGVPWEGSSIGTDKRHVFFQDRLLTYARLEGTPGGAIDSWQFTLSHHRQDEDRERIRSNDLLDLEGVDVDTYGATLQFISKTGAGKFTYGLDYYQDRINSFHDDYNAAGVYTGSGIQGPVGDDGKYHLFGFWCLCAGCNLSWRQHRTYSRCPLHVGQSRH
jgi:hemoglobin/transferrin/lactoferrin receptor protein